MTSRYLFVIALALVALPAHAETRCTGLSGHVVILGDDNSIQLGAEQPHPATYVPGKVNVYTAQDGAAVVLVANPAFAGANCQIHSSPLPHGARWTACMGTLELPGADSEQIRCITEH